MAAKGTVRRSLADGRAVAWISGAALAATLLLPADRLLGAWRGDLLAYDFRQTFLPAAERLLDGSSPYPEYGYPPLVAFLSVPFAILPSPELVVTALLLACVPLSLWLFGVRDWRCYAAAFLWVATFNAIQTANVTLPLLVGAAACWHWRDRAPYAAAAGGLAIAAKIVAWPLVLWHAATRRLATAAGLVAVAMVVTFGLWALLGFHGLRTYPDSLDRLQASQGERGYTVQALVMDAGFSERAGSLFGILLALVVLALVVVYGRRGDDARSFACAAVAMIVASPIVWLHSYALLLAPLAVLRPRLSWVWLLPALLWFVSPGTGNGAPWQTAITLGVAALVVLGALLGPRPEAADWRARRRAIAGGAA
jgi:Glycosyltransferase family 87